HQYLQTRLMGTTAQAESRRYGFLASLTSAQRCAIMNNGNRPSYEQFIVLPRAIAPALHLQIGATATRGWTARPRRYRTDCGLTVAAQRRQPVRLRYRPAPRRGPSWRSPWPCRPWRRP